MPKEKQTKTLCVNDLRHAEYYGMQEVYDNLYAKSKDGQIFENLMDIILERENILLAYRNIKTNTGSKTAGTDGLKICHIGKLTPEKVVQKVRFIVSGSKHGYRPKPVRRKDIPKPNGTTRPLGIPCIWDRLIQQCIKQVLEPICEAKFSHNSYGFRPNRSAGHAMRRIYNLMQLSNLHYAIEIDIKGFFDNVNHSKMIKQIWAMGIRDKHLIYVVKQILKAPIKMPNGEFIAPDKGTPQGGILSPLLANIVLNEFDKWIESQWQDNPITQKYLQHFKDGTEGKSHGYRAMKTTKLKEMFIVRYADDFRIFCKNKVDAEKTLIAASQWLKERLKLDVAPEKTRIVNVRQRYMEFLGFKIKVKLKGKKFTVISHISDKQLSNQCKKLKQQAKYVARPRPHRKVLDEIKLYNSMVVGVQEYYKIASCISFDCNVLKNSVSAVFANRLRKFKQTRMSMTGRNLTQFERERYGKAKLLRFIKGIGEPIYPINYVRYKNPVGLKAGISCYTESGRENFHNNLRINIPMMLNLMRQPVIGKSIEYADNRISHFSAQWGKCAVCGELFQTTTEIHCHHIIPKSKGGLDKYDNLVLVTDTAHKLIHATDKDVIGKYIEILKLNKSQLSKLNKYREIIGLDSIATQENSLTVRLNKS